MVYLTYIDPTPPSQLTFWTPKVVVWIDISPFPFGGIFRFQQFVRHSPQAPRTRTTLYLHLRHGSWSRKRVGDMRYATTCYLKTLRFPPSPLTRSFFGDKVDNLSYKIRCYPYKGEKGEKILLQNLKDLDGTAGTAGDFSPWSCLFDCWPVTLMSSNAVVQLGTHHPAWNRLLGREATSSEKQALSPNELLQKVTICTVEKIRECDHPH